MALENLLADLGAEVVDAQGGLIRALHWLQAHDGHISTDHQAALANMFNLTQAEVKGVISFYDDFKTIRAGNHTIRICQAEACQAVGARALTALVQDLLGVDMGGTSDDGKITLEPVACLGLCASGPAAMVDGQLKGRLSETNLRAILDELAVA